MSRWRPGEADAIYAAYTRDKLEKTGKDRHEPADDGPESKLMGRIMKFCKDNAFPYQ